MNRKEIACSRHGLLLAACVFVCLLPVLTTCEEKVEACSVPPLLYSDLETIGSHEVPSVEYLSKVAENKGGCDKDAKTKAVLRQIQSLDPAKKEFVLKILELVANGQGKEDGGKRKAPRFPKRQGGVRGKKKAPYERALSPSRTEEFSTIASKKVVCKETQKVVAIPGGYAKLLTRQSIQVNYEVQGLLCQL